MNKEFLKSEITTARKSGLKEKVITLSSVVSDIASLEIRENTVADESSCFAAIKKAIKQEKETLDMYSNNNRPELAEVSKEKIAILEAYMPKALSKEETKRAVEEAVAEVGATTMKDMGKVMGNLKKQFGATLDMKIASPIVRSILS